MRADAGRRAASYVVACYCCGEEKRSDRYTGQNSMGVVWAGVYTLYTRCFVCLQIAESVIKELILAERALVCESLISLSSRW